MSYTNVVAIVSISVEAVCRLNLRSKETRNFCLKGWALDYEANGASSFKNDSGGFFWIGR